MTTVDDLETVYRVTDRYTGPVRKMAADTVRFGSEVTSLLGKLSALAGFAGFAAIGKSAISHALAIEKLSSTFQALSGSTEIAAEKMAFLQTFAKTSIGEFEDLAEAGKLLEASGVRMERILPTLSNIAAAFGGTRTEVLELASAFGRLTSGQFGESMEIFRRFGISASDLMAQGIQFDGGGKITSSVMEVFTAIENIADKKFGKIGEIMEKNIGVKLSNVKDAFNQMLTKFGETFFPLISKVADKLITLFDFFKESGFIQEFANQVARAFENLGRLLGGEGGFTRALFTTISFLTRLPSAIFHVAEFMKGFFTDLAKTIEGFVNGFINLFNRFMVAIGGVIQGFTFTLYKPKMPQLGQFSFGKVGGFLDDKLLGGLFKDVFLDADRMQQAFTAFQTKGKTGDALPDKKTFDFLNGQTRVMEDIETNTRRAAAAAEKAVDLRRFALGGGPLGQIGVTPTEMFGGRGRRGGSSTVNVKFNEGGKLAEGMEEIVNQVIFQMIHSGLLSPGR